MAGFGLGKQKVVSRKEEPLRKIEESSLSLISLD